jgi:hypothetical protein
MPPPQPSLSPVEEISRLLDTLPLDAYVDPTRLFVVAVPNLSPGEVRSLAVLKIVVLFISDYGSTA